MILYADAPPRRQGSQQGTSRTHICVDAGIGLPGTFCGRVVKEAYGWWIWPGEEGSEDSVPDMCAICKRMWKRWYEQDSGDQGHRPEAS